MDQSRLYNQLARCTVRLTVSGGRDQGTGFFVAPGLVLTCAHVVEAAGPDQSVAVHWAGRTLPGQIVPEHFRPANSDLALLRVEPADHPCVLLHEAYTLGDEMLAFGYPLGSTVGDPVTVVSEDWPRDRGTSPEQPSLKLKQGQIQPGLSGAPLLNLQTGGVCGVVVKTCHGVLSELVRRAAPKALDPSDLALASVDRLAYGGVVSGSRSRVVRSSAVALAWRSSRRRAAGAGAARAVARRYGRHPVGAGLRSVPNLARQRTRGSVRGFRGIQGFCGPAGR